MMKTWYNADGSVANVFHYTYDPAGNMTSASNNAGAYTMTYDGDQLLTQTDPNGLTLTYAYDDNGNVTSVQDSLGGLTASVYDGNQLMSRQFNGPDGEQLREDFTYDHAGNVQTQKRYADLAGTDLVGTTQNTYDGDQLTDIVQTDGSNAVLASYSYSYDHAGRLMSETDNGVTTSYAYDSTGQLIAEGAKVHAYDKNGNGHNPGDVIGPDNELLSDGVWDYTYDTAGNRTGKTNIATGETWTYTCDNANHLIGAVDRDASGDILSESTYVYDALGNRIAQTVTTPSGTTTQRYAYDRGNIWADLDGSSSLTTRYMLDDSGNHVAQVTAGGAVYWLLADHLGSVRDVTNADGTLVKHVDYDAFGNRTDDTNPSLVVAYSYAGYRFDPTTGLYYADSSAREYDADTGTWISQDPSGLSAGPNPFEYAGNSPTNATDPSGLFAGEWGTSLIAGEAKGVPPAAAISGPAKAIPPVVSTAAKTPAPNATVGVGKSGPDLALTDTNFQRIPAQRVEDLVSRGLAQRFGPYVYIADVLPGKGYQMLLEPIELRPYVSPPTGDPDFSPPSNMQVPVSLVDTGKAAPFYRVVVFKPFSISDANDAPAVVLGRYRSEFYPKQLYRIHQGEKAPNNLKALEGTLTFSLHLLPGGAAADNLAQGNYWEALISGVGDLGTLLTAGLARVEKLAKGRKLFLLAGAALEGGVGTTRAVQGYFEAKKSGLTGALGYFGEATLRLLGAGSALIKALKTPPPGALRAAIPNGLVNAPPIGRPATPAQIATWSNRIERRGYRVIFVNEVKNGAERQALERQLAGNVAGTGVHPLTGEPIVVFANRSNVRTTSLLEEFLHAQQAADRVVVEPVTVAITGSTNPIRLTAREAVEVDVVIRMRRLLNNGNTGARSLMTEAEYARRLELLRTKDLADLKLTADQVRDLVNRYATQNIGLLPRQ
jgi:RHS repeat-associated protein